MFVEEDLHLAPAIQKFGLADDDFSSRLSHLSAC